MYPIQADIIVVSQGAIVPRLDIGGIYTLSTTGKATTDVPTVDYGFNPCAWNSLPNEGILLWKVLYSVTMDESEYAVNIVVPTTGVTKSTVSTPSSVAGTTKVPVVDNKGTQTIGSDITTPTPSSNVNAPTEHLVYFNKCTGVFRLLGVESTSTTSTPTTPSDAESDLAVKSKK